MTIERAFTICELVALRARDVKRYEITPQDLATEIAEQIDALAKAWRR